MAAMASVLERVTKSVTKNMTRQMAQDRAIREYVENQRLAAADPRIFQ